MFLRYGWLAMTVLLSILPAIARADDGADDGIPVVGRPADLPFSGASGSFAVDAQAQSTTVRAGEAITFTLNVHATGQVSHAPGRIDLRQIPAFADNFYVEDPDPRERHPDERTWQFLYRLKARRDDVSEIPAVPLVYYNPAIRQSERAFQIAFTEPISIKVLPAETYAPLSTLPDSIFALADNSALEARENLHSNSGLVLAIVLIGGPPLACAAWYLAWKDSHPAAAQQHRRHQSEAARHSLRLLRGARGTPLPERVAKTVEAVKHYLRERFELNAAEPTPAEAAAALSRVGCPADLREQAARFLAACDAARFAPDRDGVALADEGARLILAVEAREWASHRS